MPVVIATTEYIAAKILFLGSERVLLDFDIAILYNAQTKRLKESVRRNISRFPSDFMFQLTDEEWLSLRSHIASL